ncbi:hypothetical protein C1645_869917 [Glomus cerebriforme]|uniref:BTB domain-containing protein n=1 Tax=Glomus cerebriforme TaxID=658196 RepID=A0A397TSW5_9GLOM|nr:hypothetical protein C1645_869917 [Glomus cerebriforme]
MTYNSWSDLSKDLSSLLENDDNDNDYNVIIKVGKKEFHAHSNILRSRCSYFRNALSNKWSNNEKNKIILSKPNMRPEVFSVILKYIYSGSLNFDESSPQITLEILVASDEFIILEKLIDPIQTYIIEKQSEWLQLNIINSLNVACQNDHFTRLRNHIIKFVCKKPYLLFRSIDFPQLEKSALIYILKEDDLELKEIEIWENIINWGVANNNPKLSQDRTKWTDNDLLALKNTLCDFIPFIRFFHMPSNYYDELMRTPLEIILPKRLKKNVRKYHLDPHVINIQILPPRISDPKRITWRMEEAIRERGRQFDSNIINFNDINRIAGWIDYRWEPYSYQENPFEFKLLLRGSRDGFDVDTFHNLCDNKGATIIVVKVQGSRKIIGGYNPINWGKGKIIGHDYYGRIIYQDYKCYTSNSFLFSIKDLNGPTLSRVNSSIESIYWNGNKGPYFGSDLCMKNSSIWNSTHRFYEHRIIWDETFFAEDYEVFQVSIKNHEIRRKQMFENVDYKGIFCASSNISFVMFLYYSFFTSFKVYILTLVGQLIVNWVLSYYQCYYQERLLDKVFYVDIALKLVPPILAIAIIFSGITYIYSLITTPIGLIGVFIFSIFICAKKSSNPYGHLNYRY